MRVTFERVGIDECELLEGDLVLSQWRGTRHMRLQVGGKSLGVLLPATPEIKKAMSYNVAFGVDPSPVHMMAYRLPNVGANRVFLVVVFEDVGVEGDVWTVQHSDTDLATIHDNLGQAMQDVLVRMDEQANTDEATPDGE